MHAHAWHTLWERAKYENERHHPAHPAPAPRTRTWLESSVCAAAVLHTCAYKYNAPQSAPEAPGARRQAPGQYLSVCGMNDRCIL